MPAWPQVWLARPVSVARHEAFARTGRGAEFLVHHVDGGAGEILEAAGMIEIEMRQQDVAYVRGRKAQPFHLADGGLFLAKLDVEH
jgi:hypothetical protein